MGAAGARLDRKTLPRRGLTDALYYLIDSGHYDPEEEPMPTTYLNDSIVPACEGVPSS